ncbi:MULTISPECIES: mechanosensitive ion channel family protein [Psychrilyobacter]|uniref:Mechanosensitive ion channel family protein n=1 Tax=Psychrilyobacter piezotolerans TaxID=2293438 RepID=A0ABX9KCT1_9FUSO|nr:MULTISPECIES: mechanosensitive ion channel domain-containing protein [Psychrilyobacter]MCS5421642.1 mechanosensitive ion channel family protein [Psychrilyobacter sp. S5]NDI77210.1 mechanosensitive ion channel [Psychrilyobacter piezotolerans]RDE58786.1 mechanosensitive ion channel family protein [Psychrilyobacter sp. S5]REI39264.1 mechanosensitive ion channel family protein [Psychrilyobacter piezotolerans]
MNEFYNTIIEYLNVSGSYKRSLIVGIITIITLIIAVIMHYITAYIIKNHLIKLIKKSETKWDDFLIENNILEYLNALVPLIVFHTMISKLNFFESFFEKAINIGIVIIFTLIANGILSVFGDIYSTYSISKRRPIKSYLQVMSLFLMIIAMTISVGIIMDKSPLKILSGIGAMTAVIMLIFKDAILGFVASIQLAANNMVGIGDWIEMPGQLADGDVIEINLTNVKVQNFDKTITTIPSYALVSNSFRNWKGMQSAGSRRIKRSIFLDSSSVKFLSSEEVKKYKKIDLLKDYIEKKEKEIEKSNSDKNIGAAPINGRRLTNIGMFRAYVQLYLKNSPYINQNLTLLVRQQEPTFQGIPLEIYCFAKTIVWQEYEGIQSDLFEHLIPTIHEFDLAIFQNPTGNDLKMLRK